MIKVYIYTLKGHNIRLLGKKKDTLMLMWCFFSRLFMLMLKFCYVLIFRRIVLLEFWIIKSSRLFVKFLKLKFLIKNRRVCNKLIKKDNRIIKGLFFLILQYNFILWAFFCLFCEKGLIFFFFFFFFFFFCNFCIYCRNIIFF